MGLASGVRVGIQKLGRDEAELDSPAEELDVEELAWLPSSLDLPTEISDYTNNPASTVYTMVLMNVCNRIIL